MDGALLVKDRKELGVSEVKVLGAVLGWMTGGDGKPKLQIQIGACASGSAGGERWNLRRLCVSDDMLVIAGRRETSRGLFRWTPCRIFRTTRSPQEPTVLLS